MHKVKPEPTGSDRHPSVFVLEPIMNCPPSTKANEKLGLIILIALCRDLSTRHLDG